MKITILTLFPEMYDSFLSSSIVKRTIDKGLVDIKIVDIRDYSNDKHRHVDDTPYGGGAGMLMKVDVVHRAIKDNTNDNSHIILTSPKAYPYKQEDATRLSKYEDIVIVCGHYEGIDYRIEDYVDEKISIGDYVLTGGELPSMVVADSIVRLIDEAISNDSLKEESYDNGLLEYAQYTRPYEYDGKTVPEVLANGNHAEIRKFNMRSSLEETLKYRPDLLKDKELSPEQVKILDDLLHSKD